MKRTSPWGQARQFLPALLGATLGLFLLAPTPVFAQQSNPSTASQSDQSGTNADGEEVENYVYVPDFMTPQELKKHIEEHSRDIVIVDTGEPEVFEDGHIPGAVDFPYNPHITGPLSLPREKTLVLYCACNHDEDSTDVARQLSLLSYNHVKVLKGGWFEWVKLKYKTVSKDEEKPAK